MSLLAIFVAMLAALLGQTAAPSHAAKEPAAGMARFAPFLGNWEGASRFNDTAISRAHSVHSKFTCRWSPLGQYMVCDMAIEPAASQLTVYSYHPADQSYSFCSMNDAAVPAGCNTLAIDGKTWTYSGGSFDQDGKSYTTRTLNIFDKPGHYLVRVEFSTDGGKTWTSMMEGEAHRTGN